MTASCSDGKSILCAACHQSEALGTPGAPNTPQLTTSMHSLHANVIDPSTGKLMDDSTNRTACYQCHPGSTTRCLRGAMGAAVATPTDRWRCNARAATAT